jgi:hypothetical protein
VKIARSPATRSSCASVLNIVFACLPVPMFRLKFVVSCWMCSGVTGVGGGGLRASLHADLLHGRIALSTLRPGIRIAPSAETLGFSGKVVNSAWVLLALLWSAASRRRASLWTPAALLPAHRSPGLQVRTGLHSMCAMRIRFCEFIAVR